MSHHPRHGCHHDHGEGHPGRRFARNLFSRLAEHHHNHHRGGRGNRLFDHGELRFLLLHMLAEQPRHGYDLIRAIEERMAGRYAPSPGAVYPTLTLLVDQGLLAVTEDGAKKRYALTEEGTAFLAANRATVEALLARVGAAADGPQVRPDSRIIRAMENLGNALRLRHASGQLEEARVAAVVAAIDAAVAELEKPSPKAG